MRHGLAISTLALAWCAQLLGVADPNGGISDDQPPGDGRNMPGDGNGLQITLQQ